MSRARHPAQRSLRNGARALAIGFALSLGGVAALFPLGIGPAALAQGIGDLKAAKAAGFIGEKPDGLVGVCKPSAPPDAAALTASVNRERMARYQAIAAKNGTPLDQVQAVAGGELIARTPSGQCIMDASGRWVRK